MIVRRHRSAILLATLASTLTVGCKLEPETPELHYSLNAKAVEKNSDLASDPGAQAQLAGALELMFGTPAHPRYLAEAEWLDDKFDPNYWGEDHVRGDEALWKSVVESNQSHFRTQLAAIRAGNVDGVEHTRYADDVWTRWQELAATIREKGFDAPGEEGTLRDEAVRLFEEYYPTLANSAAMYRVQCYHCHGASGGGDGSTSQWLNPRPRDYRPGKFKFTALKGKARPRQEDLFRILAEGVYTTAMPSFRRFSDAQLHGLADYVRLLAIRGETEILMEDAYSFDDGITFDNVKENYEFVVGRWREAQDQLITYDGEIPEPTAERVAHGRALFMATGEKGGANCVSCHGTEGRGNGVSAWEPGKENKEYAKDDWGNEIQPRDLTRGVFRFGRRPIDLFRRIYAGINGTPMPEHFGMTITENGEQRTMTESDIWDLVFFVRTLSAAPLVASHESASHEGGTHAEGGH